jgi:putative FmdB family regulatory protein
MAGVLIAKKRPRRPGGIPLPVYEYRCVECGHCYERREGFDAPSLQVCPQCSGAARRVLHPAPIVFKGSGFYSTDHRPTRFGPDGSGEKDAESAPPESKGSEPKASESKDSEPLAAS